MRQKILLFVSFLVIASSFTSPLNATVIVPGSSIIVPTDPDPAKVKAALEEFRSLSKKERKERLKEVKKDLKEFKKDKRHGKAPSENTVLLCILAVLLPPLAVYLHEGEINSRFWISLILTLLFWLPGVIYALIIVLGD